MLHILSIFAVMVAADATDQTITKFEDFQGQGAIWTYPSKGIILIPIEQDLLDSVYRHLFLVRGAPDAVANLAEEEGFLYIELTNLSLKVTDGVEVLFSASMVSKEGVFHATELMHRTVDGLLHAYQIDPDHWIANIGQADILFEGVSDALAPESLKGSVNPIDGEYQRTLSASSECQAGGQHAKSCSLRIGNLGCSTACDGKDFCACCKQTKIRGVVTVVCKCISCKPV